MGDVFWPHFKKFLSQIQAGDRRVRISFAIFKRAMSCETFNHKAAGTKAPRLGLIRTLFFVIFGFEAFVIGCSPQSYNGNPYVSPPSRFKLKLPAVDSPALQQGAVEADFPEVQPSRPQASDRTAVTAPGAVRDGAARPSKSGEANKDGQAVAEKSSNFDLQIPPIATDDDTLPAGALEKFEETIAANSSVFHRSVSKVNAHFERDAANNARRVILKIEVRSSDDEVAMGLDRLRELKFSFDLSNAKPSDFRKESAEELFQRSAREEKDPKINAVLRCGRTPDCHFAHFEITKLNERNQNEAMNVTIHTVHRRLYTQANLEEVFGAERLKTIKPNEAAILQRAVRENWRVIQTVIHAIERQRYTTVLQLIEPPPEPEFHAHEHEDDEIEASVGEDQVQAPDHQGQPAQDTNANGTHPAESVDEADDVNPAGWSLAKPPIVALTLTAHTYGQQNPERPPAAGESGGSQSGADASHSSNGDDTSSATPTRPSPAPGPSQVAPPSSAASPGAALPGDGQVPAAPRPPPENEEDASQQNQQGQSVGAVVPPTPRPAQREDNGPIAVELIASYGHESVCGDERLKGIEGWINNPGAQNNRRCGWSRGHKIKGAMVTEIAGVKIRNGDGVFLSCEMASELAHWFTLHVQNSATRLLGEPVVNTNVVGGFACREMIGTRSRSTKPSQHAFGNAFDVQFFILANGSSVDVEKHHKRRSERREFLKLVGQKSCGVFEDRGYTTGLRTFLGPGFNRAHENHFHLDMAKRRSTLPFCNAKSLFPPIGS